jgi:Pectinacetylesterase
MKHGASVRARLQIIAALVCFGIGLQAQADQPAATETAGWKAVAGGPGTGCATDATPYEFYVHEGDPRRLAIYFQGGGACWNTRNCGLDGQRTFEPAVDDGDRPWLKGQGTGIFDVANPANPLREFTIVLAPYCTADVHLGVGTVRYETSDGKHLAVKYSGLANSQRVLDWVRQQYTEPKQVFVTGGSAGAAPSPIFASQLARHYTKARVVQLGDGAGGYRSSHLAAPLEIWGATRALKHDPLYRDLDVATANFENFYSGAAAVDNLQLAQLNSIEDRVQLFFLAQLGHQVTSLAPLLSGNLAELRRTNPKLRTYVMPGTVHTILQRPDFYTAKVDDVALTKWLDDLINGRGPRNVGDSLLVPGVDRLD